MKRDIRVFPDLDALAEGAAHLFAGTASSVVEREGAFAVALSGGSTPTKLYQRLAEKPGLPWSDIQVFWGDERCVPPGHQQSNARRAREALLSHVPIAEDDVHPIPAEYGAEEGARRYEAMLRELFVDAPRFDLILLGLGADGHTASLFPGMDPDPMDPRWVIPATAPPDVEIRNRVTLTLSVLNRARRVWFLVAGKEKREAVESILGGAAPAEAEHPAALVRPPGDLLWLLDATAAGEIGST